ncbi:RloB family protein [Streptomyces sp. NPDC101213]|uniref:RloB family protein n=1 Tax=Streptomyces sp. NPDC101213 TaxID=3366130 RepID=UPI00381F3928
MGASGPEGRAAQASGLRLHRGQGDRALVSRHPQGPGRPARRRGPGGDAHRQPQGGQRAQAARPRRAGDQAEARGGPQGEAGQAGGEVPAQVWCLFDHDNYAYVRDALDQAERAGIGVAFSHPCFEVWRLAHYKPVSGSFAGVCDGAAERLPFQRGSQDAKTPKVVLPHQVLGRYKTARKNAERMNGQHAAHVAKWDRDPYTDVHEFVEKALHIDTY